MAAGLVIPVGSLYGFAGMEMPFDSNVTGAATDLVNIQSGQIEIADAGERISGILVEAVTSSSTGAAVNITPGMQVVMDNDNDSATFAATDRLSSFFDITGGTGAQIVDTDTRVAASTTTNAAQLLCVAYNDGSYWDAGKVRSDLASDTSVGLFLLRETYLLGSV